MSRLVGSRQLTRLTPLCARTVYIGLVVLDRMERLLFAKRRYTPEPVLLAQEVLTEQVVWGLMVRRLSVDRTEVPAR